MVFKSNGVRSHSWDISAKKLDDSCSYLKNRPEARSDGELFSLAEEILRQHNNDYVAWLLIISLLLVCNENSK